jgi:hypothetical protein
LFVVGVLWFFGLLVLVGFGVFVGWCWFELSSSGTAARAAAVPADRGPSVGICQVSFRGTTCANVGCRWPFVCL